MNKAKVLMASLTRPTLQFCLQLARTQQIYTEPVYSGKALQSLLLWAQQGDFPCDSKIAFFHTGGLQGLAGLHYRGLLTDSEFLTLTASAPSQQCRVDASSQEK